MSFDAKGAASQGAYYYDGLTIKQQEPDIGVSMKAEPYPYPFDQTTQFSGKAVELDLGPFSPSSYDFVKDFH